MCVEDIACNISVVFLRHSVVSADSCSTSLIQNIYLAYIKGGVHWVELIWPQHWS